MSKSLILYENDNFKNIFKSKKFLNYKGTSFDIIKSSIYNPPFFKNFIYENPISNDDIKIAWNSTLKNGYLIIPLKFTKYLPNRKYKTVKLLNKLFAVFYKSDSETLIIYDKYRIIDFMIIGVEKGGTTSLHTNISKHPDIKTSGLSHVVKSEKWIIERPYLVDNHEDLAISKGTQIEFRPGGSLTIKGQILALGTAEKPIIFAGNKSSGQGILISKSKRESQFSHCSFSNLGNYGSGTIKLPATVNVDESNVKIMS